MQYFFYEIKKCFHQQPKFSEPFFSITYLLFIRHENVDVYALYRTSGFWKFVHHVLGRLGEEEPTQHLHQQCRTKMTNPKQRACFQTFSPIQVNKPPTSPHTSSNHPNKQFSSSKKTNKIMIHYFEKLCNNRSCDFFI